MTPAYIAKRSGIIEQTIQFTVKVGEAQRVSDEMDVASIETLLDAELESLYRTYAGTYGYDEVYQKTIFNYDREGFETEGLISISGPDTRGQEIDNFTAAVLAMLDDLEYLEPYVDA